MRKNKQWICYFIALFIFMSGMCFENIGADSLHLRDSAAGTAYTVLSGGSVSAIEAGTEEIVSAGRTLRISGVQNQKTALGKTLRLFLNYALMMAGIGSALKFYMAGEPVLLAKTDCHTAVLTYIHNTDGKKRS